MKNKIRFAVVMVVAGHKKYFEYAKFCISSFARHCPLTPLGVFTDKPKEMKKAYKKFKTIEIYDINAFDDVKEVGILKKNSRPAQAYLGYVHDHKLIASLFPMAEAVYKDRSKITHLIKIDCDGYFAGGNLMTLLKRDLINDPDYDLYLVARTDERMSLQRTRTPGVGFTVWKKGGRFLPNYVKRFGGCEQDTIMNMMKEIPTKVLPRPGYHFVFPFSKKSMKKVIDKFGPYTRKELVKYLPAYFHVHYYPSMDQMEEWFGEGTDDA